MARKARKKFASKAKRKPSAVSTKKHKTVAKNKSKVAARKKPGRQAKAKGVVAAIVADVEAVMDTLTEAERLHRKLEPRGSPESES
jgi:hypothetical protein